jgi:hypothetical protein
MKPHDAVREDVDRRRHVGSDYLAVRHLGLDVEDVRVDLDIVTGIGRENRLKCTHGTVGNASSMPRRFRQTRGIQQWSEPAPQSSVTRPSDLSTGIVVTDTLLELIEEVSDVTCGGTEMLSDNALRGLIDLGRNSVSCAFFEAPAIDKSGDTMSTVFSVLSEQGGPRRLDTGSRELVDFPLHPLMESCLCSVSVARNRVGIVRVDHAEAGLVQVVPPEEHVCLHLRIEHGELHALQRNRSVFTVRTVMFEGFPLGNRC